LQVVRSNQQEATYKTTDMLLFGAFPLLSTLHLIYYLYNPAERTNFYFTLYTLASAANFYCTGLGLSLSYNIITKTRKVTLTIDTQEGHYTECTVKLPLDASPNGAAFYQI